MDYLPLLAVALVTGAVIILAWILSRSGKRQVGSFWDFVRDPEPMAGLHERDRYVAETALSLSGSPSRIAGLVDHFVFEAESSDAA